MSGTWAITLLATGGGGLGDSGPFPARTSRPGCGSWSMARVTRQPRSLRSWRRRSSRTRAAVALLGDHSIYTLSSSPRCVPFRGRQPVIIDGAVLGDDAEAERILAPLRELGPEIDTFGRVPAASRVAGAMAPYSRGREYLKLPGGAGGPVDRVRHLGLGSIAEDP